jgi:hypothetical protein
MTWKLNRPRQCRSCPWNVSTNPRRGIPGYEESSPRHLASTIAEPGAADHVSVMTCREHGPDNEAHCVGWLVNEIGPGNKADSSGRRNTAGVTLQLGLPRFCGAVRVSGLTASRLVFLAASFGSAAIIFPSRPAGCTGRRAERRSRTAGRLSARPGSALPGRSLTGASTAAGWCAPGSRALARTPLARGSRVRNGGDADYRSLRLTREDGPAFAKPDYVTAASRPAPLRAFSSRASFSAWR